MAVFFIPGVESLTFQVAYMMTFGCGRDWMTIVLLYHEKGGTLAMIKTVSPEQADGKMKEAFDMFIENLGVIPNRWRWCPPALLFLTSSFCEFTLLHRTFIRP
jgi:hypothetical protein